MTEPRGRHPAGWGRVARVAAMAAVISMLAAPMVVAQSTVDQYLHATGGYPKSDLLPAPPSGPLLNFDPLRDGEVGLLLERTSKGADEASPDHYQLWAMPAGGLVLDGPASLRIGAAMERFEEEEKGRLDAYLLDCPATLEGCTTIGSGSVSAKPWSSTGDFVTRTISFGNVEHQVAVGRRLAVKVVVDASGSSANMMLAYASGGYPSRLSYTEAGATTTTTIATTTTSVPTTTTTITLPTTTTTLPATTTTTIATTTSVPTTTTTSTTTATTPAASSTTAASTTTTASGATSVTTPPSTPTTAEASGPIAEPGDIEPPGSGPGDLALPALGPLSSSPSPTSMSLRAIELLLPNDASEVVVGPLMVLAVMADAMFLTGRSISLPAAAAGVVVAVMIIGSRTGRSREERAA